ncbi:MAG: hypothetical protein AAGA10_09080 [Bacteroidota bacterium]
MMRRNRNLIKTNSWGMKGLLIVLAFVGCEQVKEDVLPAESTEELSTQTLFSIPGEPVVVDLLEGVSLSEPVDLQIMEAPQSGDLSLLGNTLASYETPSRIAPQSDRFTMNVKTSSTSYQRTFQVEVTDRVGYPLSEQGAVYDRGGILNPGETLIADVLQNDAEGAAGLEIEVGPSRGTAFVTEDQKISYTADPEFRGLVDVIYRVDFPNGRVGRAIVRFAISE